MTCKASFAMTLELNLIDHDRANVTSEISGSLAKLVKLHVSCCHVDYNHVIHALI